MDENPLVSVIIPTHNRPVLLLRAVESVQNQTYSNIEIIVVDDGSTIDLSNSLGPFENLLLIRNEENKGACFSRNRGLECATGDLVNFLDDDDILFPSKIKKQVELFKTSDIENLGMVTCHTRDERSGIVKFKHNRVRGDIFKQLLRRYMVSGTETLLFKTDYVREVGGFDENLQSSQEYDLLIRLSERYAIDHVDEVLTKEFRSSNQISTDFDKKIQGAKYLYAKHDQLFKNEGNVFRLMMRLKLKALLFRFYAGKIFGEKAYRILMRN